MNKPLNTTELDAIARDTSRRDWLKHAAFMVGLAATASAATRVYAADGTMMQDGAMMKDGSTMKDGSMDNAKKMDRMMVMGQNDKMSMEMPPPAPNGDQAVPNASIVANTKINPNNPALTIPGAGKHATASDLDIFNFALGLEYLEAAFYASIVDANNKRAYLSPEVARIAQGIADDEAAHVASITDLITRAKGTPVSKPNFQFPENVYLSQVAFLTLAGTFEDTGTGAYLGAAPKLKSVDALKFAASVYGIETRHASVIHFMNNMSPASTALEIALEVPEIQRRVAPFIIA